MKKETEFKSFITLSRAEKIILVMYELSGGSRKSLKFEDIVVALFKKFPNDFCLKGYPQYPDSGDLVHKPLYSTLKPKGLVLSGNKMFSLTEKGIVFAKRIKSAFSGKSDVGKTRLTRDIQKELDRILRTEGYILFQNNQKEKVLDTDFYSYLGVTVRTPKNEFLGRLQTVKDAIETVDIKNSKVYKGLRSYHDFLLNNFSKIIEYKTKKD